MNSNTHDVYIAFGTNLGDRVHNLQEALALVTKFATIDQLSSIYETAPAYVVDQPAFLNGVCQIQTDLSPHELLDALEGVMTQLGRKRTLRYGPRIIDLDIIFYDEITIETELLTIPHPRLAERDFVLGPLREIAPDFCHPALGQSVEMLWQALGAPPLLKFQDVHNITIQEH